ncbi:hypothetical protein AQUCO_06500021v1 [Aquilegia coerulea]|uniref:Uncharacterized protein n=1 Tax=Aquilegia coerulea TaxID=218851 RepID=A0A2G5CCB9_AQUCA|nr:hypothetical protein AQUCO_06500021v1 [Aquilegia coerulea]
MEEIHQEDSSKNEILKKDTPQLAAVLKEMNEVLDTVSSKVQILTSKVKEDNYPTTDGISYLEAKHLMLLNYCQSVVYYVLRKVKGLSVEGHPVVQSLLEIRLFLEKVRPIDKKLHYQIDKLLKIAKNFIDDLEGRPEEIVESVGAASKELTRLMGLTDGFEDEVRAFGFGDDYSKAGFNNSNRRGKKI